MSSSTFIYICDKNNRHSLAQLNKVKELRRQATDFKALIFNNLVFFILSNNYVHVLT
jgi:hypothetical protein